MAQERSEGIMRILTGDCREKLRELPDSSVDLILTDLPYGEVSQKSSGLRRLDRGDADRFDINIAELVDEFVRICRGSFYLFCGTEQISPLVERFRHYGLTTRVGAWNKTNPSPMNGGKIWVSGLEFCVFARKAKATFTEHCKKALWDAPSGRAKSHPTEKPVALFERLLTASSLPNDLVVDPFLGSGTTLVAALKHGRRAIGIELNPEYVAIAERRLGLDLA